MSQHTPLPECVARLFWDSAPGAVDWDRHRDHVIARVLSRGDWDAVRWVRAQAGDPGLRDAIRRARGRFLTPPQIRFWQLVLDLSEEEVAQWLAVPARDLWDRRAG